MADEASYRCINDACGRPAPRRVNFCPWCGTAQTRAGARAASAATAAAAAAAGASAAASLSGWSDAPPVPDATPTPSPPPPPPPPTPPTPRPPPAGPPSASDFGRSGKGAAQPGTSPQAAQPGPAQAPPQQEVPRPPLAAHPTGRKPIRLRWWLLVLAVLWTLWLLAKPSPAKIERRIDAAIAMARECKASAAQDELIALRKSRATPEQLQRLQQALNDEAARCTKRRQRAKAWSETSEAAEAALASNGWDKARTRLQAFTRRWGEDDDTRALRTRIEDARREDEARRSHPLAVPPASQGEGANQ